MWTPARNYTASSRLASIGPVLTFSPDGKWLAGKGRDGSLYVWSAASGKVRRRFELPLSRTIITANGDCPLAFSPDGKTLAAAHGLTIHLWDLEANKELHEPIGHLVPVEDVRFSADGQRILTCSREETYQWETTTAKVLHRRARGAVGYPPPVVAVDDAAVIVAQASGLNRWNVETGQAADRALVSGLSGSIIRLNRSSNGKTLAGYTSDHFIHLWDAQSGKERSKWKAEQTSRPVLALSADGALLAIAYANTTVRLWDVAAGREIRQFNDGVPPPSVSEVASPGQIIRSAFGGKSYGVQPGRQNAAHCSWGGTDVSGGRHRTVPCKCTAADCIPRRHFFARRQRRGGRNYQRNSSTSGRDKWLGANRIAGERESPYGPWRFRRTEASWLPHTRTVRSLSGE